MVAWGLEGKGQGVDYSWRSQPEGIDFSCRLLFQSWLERFLASAVSESSGCKKVTAKSANECYPTTDLLFGVCALDIRVSMHLLMLEIYRISIHSVGAVDGAKP